MGKKKDEGGAPAYMGLFTSLMTVLLAFFILMVSMADSQDSGFYDGVGSVENTHGITGGLGMMAFARSAGESGILGIDEGEPSDRQNQMHPEGSGGFGGTDAEVEKSAPKGKFIRIYIPFNFKAGLSTLERGSKFEKYLSNVSLSLLANGRSLTVLAYANDGGAEDRNRVLAVQRAQTICNVLQRSGIEFDRLSSVGYGFDRYLKLKDDLKHKVSQENQAAFFYYYQK